LVAGTDFPPHARSVDVLITAVVSLSSAGIQQGFLGVGNPGGSLSSSDAAYPTFVWLNTNIPSQTGSVTLNFKARIPIANYYEILGVPGTTPPGATGTSNVFWQPGFTGSGSVTSASLTVAGWELLDAD
jgi:hypothetical protein